MLKRRFFLSACIAMASLSWTTLYAANFNVNSFSDTVDKDLSDGVCLTALGQCTLRAAVMQANHSADADVITLPAGRYNLTLPRTELGGWDGELNDAKGDFDIFHSVTIRGSDPTDSSKVVINARGDGGLGDRIFHVKGAEQVAANQSRKSLVVVFEGLTLLSGYQVTESNGGGAMLIAGSRSGLGVIPQVTIKNVAFRYNYSPYTGSGLSNWGGDVVIEDSIFDQNASGYYPDLTSGFQSNPTPRMLVGGGSGGGIAHWGGEMTLRRVIVSSNTSQMGGGIYTQDTFPAARLLIEDSSITNNLAFMGAGLASFAGITASDGYGVRLVRTTFSNNDAELAGGAVYNAGALLISNSTLTANRAWDGIGNPRYPGRGGGLYNSGRVVDIVSSTIAGNEAEETRLTGVNSDGSTGGDEIFYDYLNSINGGSSTALSRRFTIKSSIIGNGPPTNTQDPDFGKFVDDNCNGPVGYQGYITSLGGNVDTGSTCLPPVFSSIAFVGKALASVSPSDLVSVNSDQLGLGDLSDNGGFAVLPGSTALKTLALSNTSLAIGMGKDCPGSDQRNFARVDVCDSGAFQVNVDATRTGNAAPLAESDVVSVNIGSQVLIDVLANDSDPDVGGGLSIVSVSDVAAELGQVTIVDGRVRYASPAALDNLPVKVNFTYTVSDGALESQGQVSVWLYGTAVNTPPVGVDDHFITGEGVALYLDVLGNDSDADLGDDGRLRIFSESSANSSVQDQTVVVIGNNTSTSTNTNTNTNTNSNVDIYTPNGSLRLLNDDTVFRYTPNNNFSGEDVFTYAVVDPRGAKSEGVKVKVVVNKSPVIREESVTLQVEAGGVVSGSITVDDSDSDGLVFFGVNGAKGDVELDETRGTFTYKAKMQTTGADEFVISVSDGRSVSSIVAQVLIDGDATAPPVAVADSHDVMIGQAVDIDLVANDTDPSGVGQLVISGELTPVDNEGGSLVKLSDTVVRFTPAEGFSGTYQFAYSVENADGVKSDTTTVTLNVRSNRPPVFLQGVYEVFVEVGTVYSGQIKANDADGDAVSYTINQGQKGSVTYDAQTGKYSYSASSGETGVDEILVTAKDAFGEQQAKIIVNVQARSNSSVAISDGTGTGGTIVRNNDSGGGAGAFNAFLLLIMGLLLYGRKLRVLRKIG